MPGEFWIPTSADIRRQCNAKLLEAEKDFWMEIAEMHQGMLDSIWDEAKNDRSIVLRRTGEKIVLVIKKEGQVG